jgi:hypothetical protein
MKPSYTSAYRKREYRERDKKPKVRSYLLAVRFSKGELKAFKEMTKKPSTKLRELALAWAGYRG